MISPRNRHASICIFTTSLLLTIGIATQGQSKRIGEKDVEKRSVGYDLVMNMFEHCAEVQTLRCKVSKTERYEGEYLSARSLITMKCVPYSVYLKQLEPTEGVEVLFREDRNNNKVLVNPNGFPWINLNLDPAGSLMRNKQHHMVYDMGFSKFNRVLEHLLQKYDDRAHEMVSYVGEETINGRKCGVVEILNHFYSLTTYTVGTSETTRTVADSLKIAEYRIIELNPQVSAYGPLKPGTVLTIPNDYAPKIRIFIDREWYIPVRFEVYDDDLKLFEAYEYEEIEINVPLKEGELTKGFKDYGF